jgi:hypothetical protein
MFRAVSPDGGTTAAMKMRFMRQCTGKFRTDSQWW